MKKILLTIYIFLFFPLISYAANYKITDQLIDAQITKEGDLNVTELIVMEGTFNGYEKTLNYQNTLNLDNNSLYNGSSIELISFKGKYIYQDVDFDTLNDADFTMFTLDNMAVNGDMAKYSQRNDIYGYTYRLYYHANSQKVAFLINYLVKDVVVIHDSFAELYWNFITPNDYDDIYNVQVKVSLPDYDNTDFFRLWAHGTNNNQNYLLGEISKVDNRQVLASIGYMANSDVLDIRLTFNASLITNPNAKKDYNTTLEDIIEEETLRANEANEERAQALFITKVLKGLTLTLIGTYLCLFIFTYFKFAKSPKSSYFSKYNREFIDDYNVEVIDYLMHHKITPNAMSASIMNLIYKKNIKVEEIPSTKKTKDYKFILNNLDNTNETEKYLINFLFNDIGKTNEDNTKEFTTTSLKKYAKSSKYNVFITNYTKWKNQVQEDGVKEQFYVNSSIPIIISCILLFISFCFYTFALNYIADFWPLHLILLLAIIYFIYTLLIHKKTPKGSEHYAKWRAFKNFLDDFGTFDLKELPEIALWERYLVYAVIFGLATKVQKVMNVKIADANLTDTNYIPLFYYYDLSYTINNAFNEALTQAYQRRAQISSSSFSSGGGFGGGFSSGGGFGGGGSSGHGF